MTPSPKDMEPALDGQVARATFRDFVQEQVRQAIRATFIDILEEDVFASLIVALPHFA